jgi:hypothetical protein
LQDVEWNGILGFDDEGTTRLKPAADATPAFIILDPPELLRWRNDGREIKTKLPREWQPAEGGKVPVVNLDPDIPFFHVTAAMVFPADDDTEELFETARATKDNLGQLSHYTNFRMVRWVRPENIRISSPWTAVAGPDVALVSVAPRKPWQPGPDPRYAPKASELAPRDQWGSTLPGPPRVYVVAPNDNLSKIAQKLLGDPNKYQQIVEANKGKIDPKTLTIYPGQKLVIPGPAGTAPASPPPPGQPFGPNTPIA